VSVPSSSRGEVFSYIQYLHPPRIKPLLEHILVSGFAAKLIINLYLANVENWVSS
jgi:hypothetical protein